MGTKKATFEWLLKVSTFDSNCLLQSERYSEDSEETGLMLSQVTNLREQEGKFFFSYIG